MASAPLAYVSQVVLFGNIGLTTLAIGALLDQGTEVVFLTEHGDYRGRLVGSLTPHVPLLRLQYARLGQPDFVLELAKGFVAAKLDHQHAMLLRHNRERRQAYIAAAIAGESERAQAAPAVHHVKDAAYPPLVDAFLELETPDAASGEVFRAAQAVPPTI